MSLTAIDEIFSLVSFSDPSALLPMAASTSSFVPVQGMPSFFMSLKWFSFLSMLSQEIMIKFSLMKTLSTGPSVDTSSKMSVEKLSRSKVRLIKTLDLHQGTLHSLAGNMVVRGENCSHNICAWYHSANAKFGNRFVDAGVQNYLLLEKIVAGHIDRRAVRLTIERHDDHPVHLCYATDE